MGKASEAGPDGKPKLGTYCLVVTMATVTAIGTATATAAAIAAIAAAATTTSQLHPRGTATALPLLVRPPPLRHVAAIANAGINMTAALPPPPRLPPLPCRDTTK